MNWENDFYELFINDNYSYSTGNLNISDAVLIEKLKIFISNIIKRTKEETIIEIENNLPRKKEINLIENNPIWKSMGDADRAFNSCLDNVIYRINQIKPKK